MDPAAHYETDLPPLLPEERYELTREMLRGAIDALRGAESRDSAMRYKFAYALGRLEGEMARERGDTLMTLARRWWREDRYPMPERHYREWLEKIHHLRPASE